MFIIKAIQDWQISVTVCVKLLSTIVIIVAISLNRNKTKHHSVFIWTGRVWMDILYVYLKI